MALKLVKSDTSAPTTSAIDWAICFLCQRITEEKLTCPLDYAHGGGGYKTLARTLPMFYELCDLPSFLQLSRLDEGGGIESTLMKQKAKYHKSCNLRYNDKNLIRSQKRKCCSEMPEVAERFTRQKKSQPDFPDKTCLFCNKLGTSTNPLRNASTGDLDTKVKQCAINLQDEQLLAKLSRGDVVAIEMKYHPQCLVTLYNRDRALSNAEKESSVSDNVQNTAFAELLSYMEEVLTDEETTPVFQLSELTKLYTSRLLCLGENLQSRVHSTRFKNRILGYFPELEAHNEGRDILLVPSGIAGKSIRNTCQLNGESETVLISRVADIVRREMFNHECPSFDCTFAEDCQQRSVPQSLLTLLTMILHGTSIKNETNYKSQAALSLAQLIFYNSVRHPKTDSKDVRHRRDREPPLPLFVGAYVHSKSRSKDMIDTLHKMGLSVTYDRVLRMSTDLANSAINHYESVGTVCPPVLRTGIFTSSAVDNIDHNPSSTSAQSSFHGTGISIFQHPDADHVGADQEQIQLATSSRKITKLPDDYTLVPAVVANKNPSLPEVANLQKPETVVNLEPELQWCQHVYNTLSEAENLDHLHEEPSESDTQNVSWAAYHANLQSEECKTSISALLPLFPDDSKSVAMIKHAMDVVKRAVNVVNPGQTPVIACDQPLYKIAKDIQWTWPETHGEDCYVVMLGGLHIKMTLLKCLGDLLDGCGWTSALIQAEIANPGTADSFLKASHVKKTARAHQVTACALYKLRQDAYDKAEGDITFEMWSLDRRSASAQFKLWELILNIELTILTWDRSIHEGNFPLYVETLSALQWIFHALDHHHYARATAVHLRDMSTLQDRHPTIYAEFCKGNFTVSRSNRPFSRMPLDEGHEQNNASVKDEGGAIGLTEKPTALLRWMVGGPELARVVTEFLVGLENIGSEKQTHHHEAKPGTQKTFLRHVTALVEAMSDMGNPFLDTSGDLLVLDTRVVVDSTIVDSIRNMERLGQERCDSFFNDRLIDRTTPLHDTITKANLPLFNKNMQKENSREQKQLKSLKRDRTLFSTLYIVCQVRQTNMADFFAHENQSYPPSLSDYGSMRYGTKADLLACVEELVPHHETVNPLDAQMIILDGAAIVNMIKPGTSESFDDYILKIIEYIRKQFRGAVLRVDMVFDIYKKDSLKAVTRKKRGKGTRRRVEGKNKIPSNWPEFLRVDENKSELFALISERVANEIFPGLVIITRGKGVISSGFCDLEGLTDCTHEEADTRMLLHASHGALHGMMKILIRTVDTDVVVLSISLSQKIACECLWLAFGTGNTFRYLDATAMAQVLGEAKCKALPAFHAFSGCDVTSSFSGKGKRTAWKAWNAFDDATAALCILATTPTIQDIRSVLQTIERLVVLMYDRGSSESNVNCQRQILFASKGREIENLPPTQDALSLHLLRVGYQAGHVWGQALIKEPQLPSPANFGWMWETSSGQWSVKWMTLPPAGEACRAVIKCGCTKGCRKQCKCKKADLMCTTLCRCGGCC